MTEYKLKSGRVFVAHPHPTHPSDPSLTQLLAADGGGMSDAEWTELADQVRKIASQKIKEARAARHEASKRAFANRNASTQGHLRFGGLSPVAPWPVTGE